MNKKYFYFFTVLSIYSISIHADMHDESHEKNNSSYEFNDIFDLEDDEQILVHEHDSEEAEMENLEEFVVKPTPPSQSTVLMRQLGIKMLIGYIAMRSYFKNLWLSVKENAIRFRSWVLSEQIN